LEVVQRTALATAINIKTSKILEKTKLADPISPLILLLRIPVQHEHSFWPSVNAYSGLTVNKHSGFSVNDFSWFSGITVHT